MGSANDHAAITPERLEQLQRAAQQLVESRWSRIPFTGLDKQLRPKDPDEAYRIQRIAHARQASLGHGEIAGHKIGCTTPTMQAYLRIPHPCGGGVLAPMVKATGGHFDSRHHLRIGVECEIGVRLGRDLLADATGKVAKSSAAAAVSACFAAIEVVEDRYVDYPSLDTPTLIADDFFSLGCVLGTEFSDFPAQRLDTVKASMEINGVEVGRGAGTDVLGHPLVPLCWLAENAARLGHPLRAGEFVLLGSLVQTNWLRPGDTVRIINDQFGDVVMQFD